VNPEPETPDASPAVGATRPLTARFALRAATGEAHDRLDALYSAFDLGRPADYATFLLSHAPAFLAVEAALDAAGAETVIDGWAGRRRSGALKADLTALDLRVPAPATFPALDGEAAILGAAYVLEGSRLGGAMLVRTVGHGLPTAFLTPGNPSDWRAFISRLDERLSSEESLADAASAALSVFTLFERSALAAPEPIARDL